MDTRDNETGWSFGPMPRGFRLAALIAGMLILSFITIAIGDSRFSNWGVQAYSGWQLISNGHYSTNVPAGGRTDLTTGTAYVKSGHTLVVDYTVNVDDGSAFINVFNSLNLSADALYYESIEQDRQRHVEIPVRHTGLYAIDMSYYGFRGAFDVRWHVD